MKLKAWMKWVGAVAVVAAAGYGYHAFEQYRMAPQLNLHPSKFMVIHGKISPKYKHVNLYLSYQTNNPACQVTVNFFEGVFDNRYTPFTYNLKPNAQGEYAVKLPTDKVLPGYCRWGVNGLSYGLISRSGLSRAASIAVIDKEPKAKLPRFIVSCQHDVWNGKAYLLCTKGRNQKYFAIPIGSKETIVDFKYMKRIPR
jgi:hypothetical protein